MNIVTTTGPTCRKISNEDDTRILWNLKKLLGRNKIIRSAIQGETGVVFTDKRKAKVFVDSHERQFSPNHGQDNDLEWKNAVERAHK